MRVAISSDDKESTSYNLNNTKGFMIYDLADGSVKNQFYRCISTPEYRRKTESNKVSRQNKDKLLEAVLDCSAVISYAIGEEFINALKHEGVEVYQTQATDLKSAIHSLISGRLKALN
jgi:predicted Fe-Mo cluster-binding NifX family protein